ncbi:MAG: hypothetical protein A2Y12_11200 [Planctomycetes bacterium GWF2_42_9]|nr:MAG: hypothetical protein A2Y12_11200 [Planctomycetes bacterium GWF2_42_9]HAL45255.1 hypothetical protein [Phycisphaerales bacterium]
MTKNKNLLVLCAAVAVCTLTVAVPNHNRGSQSYEFDNEITLPEYRSDLDKMIDAYERMVDRLMYANETGADLNLLNQKMTEIDSKLNMISARLAGIEETLKIQKKPEKPLKQIKEANDVNLMNIADNTTN